jgi:hypothetical protein
VRQFARDAWAESVSRFTWPKVTPTARAAETKMLSSFCCFAMLPPWLRLFDVHTRCEVTQLWRFW